MSEPQVHDELGGVRVLVLAGEVDVHVAPDVITHLPRLLGGSPAAVLDLTEVTFFDSSGLRLLDAFSRTCADTGTGWRVVSPSGSRSRRVIELVGMAGAEVVEDRADALAALTT